MQLEVTVAYVRQSTLKQQSLDWQVDWAKAQCRERGWSYGCEYRELGGHSDDLSLAGRPRLREMLEDAKAGKFQRVVVWDRTRLARGPHLTALLEYLAACNIKVFIGDLPDAGDSTEVIIGVLQSMDKLFLKSLRKSTRQGLQRAREKGVRMKPPVGFKNSDDSTQLVIQPWSRDTGKMREMGMTPSAIDRVLRNVRLYDKDKGEHKATLDEFLSRQREGSSRRYAAAKARRDAEAHEFEVWLVEMRPAGSERASL